MSRYLCVWSFLAFFVDGDVVIFVWFGRKNISIVNGVRMLVWINRGRCCQLAAVVCMLLVSSCSSSKKAVKHSAAWAAQSMQINGNNDDWPSPYPYVDNRYAKLQYAIANDSGVLYVTVKASDAITRKKMQKSGVTLCIATDNRKNKSLSIAVSTQDTAEQVPEVPKEGGAEGGAAEMAEHSAVQRGEEPHGPGGRLHDREGKGGRHEMVAGERPERGEGSRPAMPGSGAKIVVRGTEGYDGTYASGRNKAGIMAATSVNDYGEVVWEIAVPTKVFCKAGTCLGKKIKIGFIEQALSQSDFSMLLSEGRGKPQAAKTVEMNGGEGNKEGGHGGHRGGEGGGMGGSGMTMNGGVPGVGIGGGAGRQGSMHEEEPEDASNPNSLQSEDSQVRATSVSETWKTVRLATGK